MNFSKISPQLTERLREAARQEVLEVVVELAVELATEAAQPPTSQSRATAIASRRDSFRRQAQPVERLVEAAGGEVGARAWIQQTLQIKLPALAIGRLSDLEDVVAIDLPHSIRGEEKPTSPVAR